MKFQHLIKSRAAAPSALSLVVAIVATACGGGGGSSGGGGGGMAGIADPPATGGFTDMALVSDNDTVVASATTIDANLQNPWGIAVAPGLPIWIADNNSNLSTLYSGTGEVETSTITGSNSVGIAVPASAAGVQSNPTGQVYNGAGGFLIPTNRGQETALFIFDGEGGTIAAWAEDSGATALTVYDDGVANGTNHAVYKGLAMGAVNGANYLYATDLHDNKVDVFDTTFSKPAAMQGLFIDPTMPAGFVPFGITAVNGQLYVTYAMQDAAKHDEVTGAGLGYVDVFNFNGSFVSRFATGGSLNAPWGIAVAPSGFGTIAGDVLIGNFGDGTVNVFAPNGSPETDIGKLMVTNGGTFSVPGLWSLVFGNGDPDKPLTTLFYTAGFADQTDGVFGSLTVGTATQTPISNPYGY
jgi:uncharacterized protein (TIGR03118 family)